MTRKISNKKIAAALRKAVPFLSTGTYSQNTTDYVCRAVENANGESKSVTHLISDMIHDRISPFASVEVWLGNEANIPREKLTRKNLQAYRHAWLDSLIKEFEDAQKE